MLKTLKFIAKNHFKKLILSFALVAFENILFLSYPFFGGFAIKRRAKSRATKGSYLLYLSAFYVASR